MISGSVANSMKIELTFMIAITAIGLIGVAAYAVEVPIDEEKFDTSILNCQEMEATGNLWCLWKPINNSGYTGNQTDAETGSGPAAAEEITCPDRFHLKDGECHQNPTPGTPTDKKIKPSELDFFEDMAVTLRDECSDGCKSSNEKLLEILEDPLTFCFDGDKTSVYIQSPGHTIDPTGVIPDETDNDSNHWLDILKQNREKCKADVTLDEDIHNEYHRNKAILHHWDKVNTIPDWINAITLEQGIQYPKLTEESFDFNDQKIMKEVCYGTVWKNVDKIAFGCPEDSLYKPTDHENFYAYNGTTSKLNPIFDVSTQKNWNDYQRYLSGDHSEQLQKAIKINEQRQAATKSNYGGQK